MIKMDRLLSLVDIYMLVISLILFICSVLVNVLYKFMLNRTVFKFLYIETKRSVPIRIGIDCMKYFLEKSRIKDSPPYWYALIFIHTDCSLSTVRSRADSKIWNLIFYWRYFWCDTFSHLFHFLTVLFYCIYEILLDCSEPFLYLYSQIYFKYFFQGGTPVLFKLSRIDRPLAWPEHRTSRRN